jgi:hypothetical protein
MHGLQEQIFRRIMGEAPLKEPIERKEFEFSPPAPITRVVNSTQALPEVRLVALDQA